MAYLKAPKVARREPKAGVQSLRLALTRVSEPAAAREAIIGGKIRASDFRAMRTALGLTINDAAEVLGVSSRTINRKELGKTTLSPTEGDRAYRLARVADKAIELIGDAERAKSWLHESSTYLGGNTPIQMLATEVGTDLVLESLHAIAYGGVA